MTPNQTTNHVAQNVYTLPYKQNQLKFMRQPFFRPPIETQIQAIHRENLEGFPYMHAALLQKHLAPAPSDIQGQSEAPADRNPLNSK